MTELSGDLVAFPRPDRPGCWAYRKLPDGSLLEVQLTKTEMLNLHSRQRDKELEKLLELNQHSLNQAALTLIKKAKESPLPGEIYLISLARLALEEDSPNWDDRLIALADWSNSVGTMRTATKLLEEAEIDAEDLLSQSPEEAANLIVEHLLN